MGMGNGVATVKSAIIRGTEAIPVEVTAALETGVPGITIVGMAEASVIEVQSNIRCAFRSSGFAVPRRRVAVALSPTGVRKTGQGLGLAMAAAILCASGQVDASAFDGRLLYGDLQPDCRILAPRGVEAVRQLAARGHAVLVTAKGASGMRGEFLALDTLSDLRGDGGFLALPASASTAKPDSHLITNDMYHVTGNSDAKRAIAASIVSSLGIVLIGAAGECEALAKCIPGILPPLSTERALEIAGIQSIFDPTASCSDDFVPYVDVRPDSVCTADLLGGGRPVRPGLVTKAHGGILFLRDVRSMSGAMKALETVTTDKAVTLVRADGMYNMPADFRLVMTLDRDLVKRCGKDRKAALLKDMSGIAPVVARVEPCTGVETHTSRELRTLIERAIRVEAQLRCEFRFTKEAELVIARAEEPFRRDLRTLARAYAALDGCEAIEVSHAVEAFEHLNI